MVMNVRAGVLKQSAVKNLNEIFSLQIDISFEKDIAGIPIVTLVELY